MQEDIDNTRLATAVPPTAQDNPPNQEEENLLGVFGVLLAVQKRIDKQDPIKDSVCSTL